MRWCFKYFFALLFVVAVQTVQTVFADENEGSLILVDSNDNDAVVNEDDSIQISDEVFYPTNEWQEIKPDQAIPKGLHVRINLQTGLKEAKLMENPSRQNDPEYLQRIKEITKDVSEKKKKFRSIDELKKEFEDMNMTTKTDYEIMSGLLDKLTSESVKDEEKIEIYNDLEYYLHQFDNGQDFVTMKGFERILPHFNSTNEQLRAMAAFALGSAMQNNPKVQIAALENGLLPVLLRTIVISTTQIGKSHSIYSLSCLVRRFPMAQQKFLEYGGLDMLAKLFDSMLNQSAHLKLQIKVVSLFSDLMEEELFMTQSDENLQEKKRQYNKVQLKRNLVEQGWCHHIPRPLMVADHDGREKVMQAMILLSDNCRSEFSNSRSVLKTMDFEYKELASNEDSDVTESSDKYFTHLKEMVEVLLRELSDNKDEL